MKLKKSLGQNFLKNQSVVRRIVDLIPDEELVCVEIGPGSGAVTETLLKKGFEVHAFEIDRRLENPLIEKFMDYSSFFLYMGDFLKTEIPPELSDREVAVVSNLPYNKATAIIKKVLTDFSSIKVCVFMLQKEVAQRMISEPGNKSFGSLSVFIQYHFKVKSAFTLSPKNFNPQPKVDFVRQGFRMRRKKLKNNYDFDIMTYASRIGLGCSVRAEEISPEQWIRLFEEVKRDG